MNLCESMEWTGFFINYFAKNTTLKYFMYICKFFDI